MTFVPVDLPTYPPDIEQQIIDGYQARYPQWVPSKVGPEVVLLQQVAFALAQTNTGLSQREVAELSLIATRRGRPRRLAAPAQGLAAFTVSPGFTIPAATQFTANDPDGNPVALQTINAAGGAPGQTTISDVPVRAALDGPFANGVTGTGILVDQFADILTVNVTTPLAGGQDDEDLDTYLSELVEYLQLFFDDPTLVNARQVAIFVKSHPVVARVLVLNLHVPAGGKLPDGSVNGSTPLDGVAGAIGYYAIDADGEAIPSFAQDEVEAMVQDRREAGMILSRGLPTYTSVNVTFTASTRAPNDTAAIAAARARVIAYLSPANWGQPTSGDPSSNPGGWDLERLVRFAELYAVIDNTDGINHVESLTIMGAANTNYTLPGAAPLPRPGTINGSLYTP